MLAALNSGPPHDRLVLGSGQGHIKVPEILAPAVLLAVTTVPLVLGVAHVPPDVQFATAAICGVVEHDRGAGAVGRRTVPQIGAVDDRELEALGPVNGQDVDGVRSRAEAAGALVSLAHL